MLWNQPFASVWMFPLQAGLPAWVVYVIILLVVLLVVWGVTRALSTRSRHEEEDVMRRSTADREETAGQTMAESRQVTSTEAYNAQEKMPPAPEPPPVPVTAAPEAVAPEAVAPPEPATLEEHAEATEQAATGQPAAEDDLEVIEGVGPKIAQMLRENGIHTFDQLAHTPVDRLTTIVRAAGLSLSDPSTWPEQARLAAAGDMDGLKAYQDRLKGGREV